MTTGSSTDATAALVRGFRAMSLMAFDINGRLPNRHWSTDTADGVFTFEGDRVNLSRLDLATAWAVARGSGDIYLNGNLDLTLNAGPLEKIESVLGKPGELVGRAGGALGTAGDVVGVAGKALGTVGKFVGKAAGAVTDQVMAYAVTGTVQDVKVGVKVAPGLHLP